MTHELVPADAPSAQRLSISEAMASHYNMALEPFMATMRATVFAKGMSREEEAAFLLVAKHHNLNPVTREIYAMPKKGGGIIPVVSIDGWVRMANEHHAFDGMEFADHHDGDKLVSTTCRIYRKDRSHPIAVTEYLEECRRDTEPWKMKHRMLRHKAMIQCARYAFGFAGVYDPDEAERFAEPLGASTVLPQRRAPSPNTAPMIEARAVDPSTPAARGPAAPHAEPASAEREPTPAIAQPARRAPSPSATPQSQLKPAEAAQRPAETPHYDPEKVRAKFTEHAKAATDMEGLYDAWNDVIDPVQDIALPPDRDDWDRIFRLRQAELEGTEGAEP